jgi:hypothetical protein
MKVTKIIGDLGVALSDEEFERRKVEYDSDTMYVECFLDNGTICLVPINNWETANEQVGEFYNG